MKKQIVINDLRVARNKAGLRQADCAHLLGVHETRISNIETGNVEPTAKEMATLSLVYGKPMESLLSGHLDEIVDSLLKRLNTVPAVSDNPLWCRNRTHTLSRIAERLEAFNAHRHGGA